MSPAQQEIYLTNLGLRDPILVQLGNFYKNLLQDLGKSVTYRTDVPVVTIIADKITYSLLFGLGAVAISLLIGVPLGIMMAYRKDVGWIDWGQAISYLLLQSRGRLLLSYSNVYYRTLSITDAV